MKTVLISAVLTTVDPLSISMPVAEGINEKTVKFNNFPVMARGVNDDGEKLWTGYLPATTVRGFIRRAIVTNLMKAAVDSGKPYTLQQAYVELIGQDSSSEAKGDIDLLKLRKIREENPILDLFGAGFGIKTRLLVSKFLPAKNILPDPFVAPRKDLKHTEGVLDCLSESDQAAYFGRADANSSRAAEESNARKLKGKIRAAEKSGSGVDAQQLADLREALVVAENLVKAHKDDMGDMKNSSQTITTHYALPASLDLSGRLVIERARERDLDMIEIALNELSMRPILGAHAARGCGEIKGVFNIHVDGVLTKTIAVGGWKPAEIHVF